MNNKTAVPLLRLWKFGRNRGQDAEHHNKTAVLSLRMLCPRIWGSSELGIVDGGHICVRNIFWSSEGPNMYIFCKSRYRTAVRDEGVRPEEGTRGLTRGQRLQVMLCISGNGPSVKRTGVRRGGKKLRGYRLISGGTEAPSLQQLPLHNYANVLQREEEYSLQGTQSHLRRHSLKTEYKGSFIDHGKPSQAGGVHLRRVRLFAIPCTVICQVPLFLGFPRQEDWSELPFSPPGDFPDPGIEPASYFSCIAGGFFTC